VELEGCYGAALRFCLEPAASAARALTAGAVRNGCQRVSLFLFSETDFDSAQEEVRRGSGLWLTAHCSHSSARMADTLVARIGAAQPQ